MAGQRDRYVRDYEARRAGILRDRLRLMFEWYKGMVDDRLQAGLLRPWLGPAGLPRLLRELAVAGGPPACSRQRLGGR